MAHPRRRFPATRNGINDALIFGDPTGAAYLAVSHPVVRAERSSAG